MASYKELVAEISQALLSIDKRQAKDILIRALDKYSPIEIVENIITPSLEYIGESWSFGNVSLSQVYMSGKICDDVIKTLLKPKGISKKRHPKMAIAVLEDFHTLGKKIVLSFLETSGYEVIDYGYGITVDSLVEKTIQDQIEIILISILMLPSALSIKEVKKKLKQANFTGKIVVGGAAFNFDNELYKEVGADYMCKNVSEAITVVHRITSCKITKEAY